MLRIGEKNGWSKITKRCKLHLMGKQPKCRAGGKRVKITKQKVRVTDNVNDGFDIGGFKINRVCEFGVDIKNYNMSLEIKVKSTSKKTEIENVNGNSKKVKSVRKNDNNDRDGHVEATTAA